jgi:hypothetical protein
MQTLRAFLLFASIAAAAAPLAGQTLPVPDDTRTGMLRETIRGLLRNEPSVPAADARHRCLSLPVEPPNDRLQSPHGDSLITSHCEVASYQHLGSTSPDGWFTAQYRWVSLFTAEDTARGSAARDTVTEEEAVLLMGSDTGKVRPVWHARFETGGYAVWRSITPELAAAGRTLLLSVMSCVNGTGGCSQEFLGRDSTGQWAPVRQVWTHQLPAGLYGQINHGVRIDVRTLRGSGGLYGARDPNCCPSKEIRVQLGLAGDSLVLQHHSVVPTPHP